MLLIAIPAQLEGISDFLSTSLPVGTGGLAQPPPTVRSSSARARKQMRQPPDRSSHEGKCRPYSPSLVKRDLALRGWVCVGLVFVHRKVLAVGESSSVVGGPISTVASHMRVFRAGPVGIFMAPLRAVEAGNVLGQRKGHARRGSGVRGRAWSQFTDEPSERIVRAAKGVDKRKSFTR